MLEADSIALCFGRHEVLSGCYLCCKPGEIVGLLGRNGSGKSSLMKILFGTLKPGFAHLRLNDKITKKAFLGKDIAYLPQHRFMPSFLKVDDVLNSCDARIVSAEIIKNFDAVKRNRLNSLSGGQLRFLECLWVLSRPATYILLDEPFSEIAPVHIELLQGIIRQLAMTKGIILTDHMYIPLMEISDRVILLHNNSVYNIKDESDLVFYHYIPG